MFSEVTRNIKNLGQNISWWMNKCWNSFIIPIRYWVVAKAKHQQNISPFQYGIKFQQILSYFFYNMIEWNTSSRRQRTCSMGFVKHSGRGPPSRQILFSISILVTSSKPRGTVACMEKYLQWFTNASYIQHCEMLQKIGQSTLNISLMNHG